MTRMSPRIGLFAAFGLLTGCGAQPPEDEPIAQAEQAVNVCNGTPAANLYVDGIPAYAQCTASTNSAIYSNNGVDTATSSQGSDWVRTQYSGGYQCTELVHRYWLFKWKITWIPNGNAGTWCNTAPTSTSGIVQTTTPVHGDAIVFAPGSCGADSTTGHVALVDTVDTAGSKVTFVEQNNAGRRTGAWSCAACFLHVVANTGSAGSTGTGGAASGTGGATTSSTGGIGVGIGGTGPSTGGSNATGGRNNLGGGTSTATGGNASNTGGAAVNTGGRSTGGATTAPATGGTLAATGGSNANAMGGTNTATGGASISSGGANVVSTGGTTSTGTPPSVVGGSAQGGSAVGGESSVAAGGQAVTTGTSAPDPDSGCSCSVRRTRDMTQTLAWFGVVLALLGRRRYRRARAVR